MIWKSIDTIFHFPVQQTFFNPDILAYLYLVGAVIIPIQILILAFMSMQEQSAGATGHFWVDSDDSPLQRIVLLFPLLFFAGYFFISETQIDREASIAGLFTYLLAVLGFFLTGALGGKHRRMLVLDKPLSFGGFSFKRKSKTFLPFEKPTQVSLQPIKIVTGKKNGLNHIFAQRPQELADMADTH